MSVAVKSLSSLRRLSKGAIYQQRWAFATKETRTKEPLEDDPRTTKPQQVAHDTDEATKDSIRHAAEGDVKEAVKDVGAMAKNAAYGAAQSAKLMADSVSKKASGKTVNKNTQEDLKQGK